MKMFRLTMALLIGCAAGIAAHADGFGACHEHLPYGTPTVAAGLNTTPICHAGYAALVDDDALVPRWVAYHLTGDHTLGCLPRDPRFHVDEQDATAKPANYAGSGYDIGHMMNAEDGAWDQLVEHDTFSTANVAPQLPHLNREIFERVEDVVRAMAWSNKEVLVYVGPIIHPDDEKIGAQRVDAPAGFFKVVVAGDGSRAVAFEFDKEGAPKGDVAPFAKAIAEIEAHAQISLPLPAGIDKGAPPVLLPFDLARWRAARKAACSH